MCYFACLIYRLKLSLFMCEHFLHFSLSCFMIPARICIVPFSLRFCKRAQGPQGLNYLGFNFFILLENNFSNSSVLRRKIPASCLPSLPILANFPMLFTEGKRTTKALLYSASVCPVWTVGTFSGEIMDTLRNISF